MNYFNNNDDQVMLFVKVYFITIIREWVGIDKWRIDKFMMMLRSMLKQSFAYICSKKWNKDLIETFTKIILELPCNINDASFPDGEPLKLEFKLKNSILTFFIFIFLWVRYFVSYS